MTSLLWAAVLLFLPLVLLWHLTESRQTKIQRMRRNQWTWARIAKKFNCSPSTARRWSLA